MYQSYSSEDSDEMSSTTKWWVICNSSNRRFQAHPINLERQSLGEYHHLFQQLKEHPDRFYAYMRMSPETFYYIYDKTKTQLELCNYNNYHINPILAEEKLVVTLRYLATGCSFKSLSFSFRMGASKHMQSSLGGTFSYSYEKTYNIGLFTSQSGSMFFNYKHYFSIVLQGLVDDHYRFISIDVGGYGKQSDGGTFQASELPKLLEQNRLGIPEEKTLPNSNQKVPYVFIADEAYPLKENLMKPYSGRSLNPSQENFNKRLSCARKTVECAFGILFSKWRILSGVIETHEETADSIIAAICILHNALIDKESHLINIAELPIIPNTCNLQRSRAHNRSNNNAKVIREKFTEFFAANPINFQ